MNVYVVLSLALKGSNGNSLYSFTYIYYLPKFKANFWF